MYRLTYTASQREIGPEGLKTSDLPMSMPAPDSRSQGVLDELHTKGFGEAVETNLETDEQVIARVTDGIYRQPASAFRELISNAYDADASRVVIKTDQPRFQRITVEDDGNGMTEEALVNLVHHIGGSSKRSEAGVGLRVTNDSDSALSPGGRRLIGKIGIGLFSVSQLTRTFHIVTKAAGTNHRLICSVVLRQFDGKSNDTVFKPGLVQIWKEPALDTEAHGTTIILDGIRSTARQTLCSDGLWTSLRQAIESEENAVASLPIPRFYVGSTDPQSDQELIAEITNEPAVSLPWDESDTPLSAFRQLVDSVWDSSQRQMANPKLDSLFDEYLQVIWQLGLAVPVDYVEKHPFDTCLKAWSGLYAFSNKKGGSAQQIPGEPTSSPRSLLNLTNQTSPTPFRVLFDDVEIRRPLCFESLPQIANRIAKPLMFVGQCTETFKNQPVEFSGGPLSFEAYLMWSPKILPVDHQGVLIRILGASGTLFDPTFLKYQTSELFRMRQITCEIFVTDGLEGALNIDRESLNESHSHSVFLRSWLHNALRQFTAVHKRVAKELREDDREEAHQQVLSRIDEVVNRVRYSLIGEELDALPSLRFIESDEDEYDEYDEDYLILEDEIFPQMFGRDTVAKRDRLEVLEKKTEAIGNVIAAFGILDSLTPDQRNLLLKAIFEVLCDEEIA